MGRSARSCGRRRSSLTPYRCQIHENLTILQGPAVAFVPTGGATTRKRLDARDRVVVPDACHHAEAPLGEVDASGDGREGEPERRVGAVDPSRRRLAVYWTAACGPHRP